MSAGKVVELDVQVLTIEAFCRSHGISQPMYFKLKKVGRAPVEMRVGRRCLISFEAARDWRRAMEQRAEPKAA